jgi:hypothetical protein
MRPIFSFEKPLESLLYGKNVEASQQRNPAA